MLLFKAFQRQFNIKKTSLPTSLFFNFINAKTAPKTDREEKKSQTHDFAYSFDAQIIEPYFRAERQKRERKTAPPSALFCPSIFI
ncbi:hypothetical protein HQ39_08895 [Porphyromonas sp. COT-108 OH2963]|nr:hypothetical protein HQ39_08895 [Porphyromonas sp. COT-108 OH2963]